MFIQSTPLMSIVPASGSKLLARILRSHRLPRPQVGILEPARSPELLALHLPSVPFASAPVARKDV